MGVRCGLAHSLVGALQCHRRVLIACTNRIYFAASGVAPKPDPPDLAGLLQRQAMSDRDDEHFELDDEFLNEQEESPSAEIEKIMFDRVDRRAKPAAVKRGKAAWSRLEDVLADRRLEKELREFFEEEK